MKPKPKSVAALEGMGRSEGAAPRVFVAFIDFIVEGRFFFPFAEVGASREALLETLVGRVDAEVFEAVSAVLARTMQSSSAESESGYCSSGISRIELERRAIVVYERVAGEIESGRGRNQL